MKFGFLIDGTEFDCLDFSIRKTADYSRIIEQFYSKTKVSDGWIYGPEHKLNHSAEEKRRFTSVPPVELARFYKLLPTHEIHSDSADNDFLEFLVLGYGFLQGLYLCPDGFNRLNRVPYQPGKLNGLILTGADHVRGMNKISRFYKASNGARRRQMFACIHWFLVGQTYHFPWDKFDAQYKVLDGLYKISEIVAGCHAERPVLLAERYGIKLPIWAEITKSPQGQRESPLSKIRNELTHEAIFAGHPVGYSHPSINYALEFSAFNTKLISAILGLPTPYLDADPKNRDMWAWDFEDD